MAIRDFENEHNDDNELQDIFSYHENAHDDIFENEFPILFNFWDIFGHDDEDPIENLSRGGYLLTALEIDAILDYATITIVTDPLSKQKGLSVSLDTGGYEFWEFIQFLWVEIYGEDSEGNKVTLPTDLLPPITFPGNGFPEGRLQSEPGTFALPWTKDISKPVIAIDTARSDKPWYGGISRTRTKMPGGRDSMIDIPSDTGFAEKAHATLQKARLGGKSIPDYHKLKVVFHYSLYIVSSRGVVGVIKWDKVFEVIELTAGYLTSNYIKPEQPKIERKSQINSNEKKALSSIMNKNGWDKNMTGLEKTIIGSLK